MSAHARSLPSGAEPGEQGQRRNIAFLGFSCYIGRYQETLSTPCVIKKEGAPHSSRAVIGSGYPAADYHENLSNTWTKLEYVGQKRSNKIRDVNDG